MILKFTVTFLILATGVLGNFKLRIAHMNDMHSRIEQISQNALRCSDSEAAAGKCYGGFARVATALREAREKANSDKVALLTLNGGDNYQGSYWFSLFRWKIVSQFVNALHFDALALGNHEFDDGISGLIPFLKNSTSPVLVCNLDLKEEPDLKRLLLPSLVIDRNATRIGIIGYITKETKSLAPSTKIVFKDEVECINKEAARLKALGVKIIIALGHSGYEREQEMAKIMPDVDVVVGAHSHTFLYTGTPLPDKEKPVGPYPTIVTQKSGRIVPVVQAFAYTKYLGLLDVEFDENGEVKSATGSPKLLDNSVAQDSNILKDIEGWKPELKKVTEEIIGSTRVDLDGHFHSCRFKECNLGNFIADAMIDYVVRSGNYNWTLAAIALIPAGSIRSSVPSKNDSVIYADILDAFPYSDFQMVVNVNGSDLKEILEWSVFRYDSVHGYGEFLQVSGIQVAYDLSKKPGSRITKANVLCSECRVPQYEPLDVDKSYNVIVNNFMGNGGDNYVQLKRGKIVKELPVTYQEIFAGYLKRVGVAYPKIDNRIVFENQKRS